MKDCFAKVNVGLQTAVIDGKECFCPTIQFDFGGGNVLAFECTRVTPDKAEAMSAMSEVAKLMMRAPELAAYDANGNADSLLDKAPATGGKLDA